MIKIDRTKVDFIQYTNERFQRRVTLENSITGYTFTGKIEDQTGDYSCNFDISTNEGTKQFTFSIVETTMALLTPGYYYYDVKQDTGTVESVLFRGRIDVRDGIT